MSTIKLKGSSSGEAAVTVAAAAGTPTFTLPTTVGSANQLLKNSGTAGTLQYSSLVEDSSGRVGMGTASPNKPLHIYTGSSDAEIRLQTNSGTEQNAYITARNSGGALDVYSVNSAINFHPDNTKRLEVLANGNVEVTDGDLVIGTSGHGIDFSATGGPDYGSGTSEKLTDYEEGTWSPDFYYHSSVANVSGQYTKIGRMVYAYFAGTIYSSQSDHQRINNLPFTTVNLSGGVGGVARGYQNFDIQNGPIYYIEGNSTRVYFYKDNGNNMSAADCNGLDFRGMVVYTAA